MHPKINISSKSTACGKLYIVATPIGNLADITYRAIETLTSVDFILCENTKNSYKLLSHYGIKTKLRPYNDHSTVTDRTRIINQLMMGNNIALISDAGTPLISDPGYKLVESCKAENLCIVPIPGATAITTSLCASGMPTDKFLYWGFLPTQDSKLEIELRELKAHPFTLVFYESPKRIYNTVKKILNILGDRSITIARELTKLHEEFINCKCSEFVENFIDKIFKGEIVLIVAGFNPDENQDVNIGEIIQKLLVDHSLKDAVSIAHELTKISKKEIYNEALKLKS